MDLSVKHLDYDHATPITVETISARHVERELLSRAINKRISGQISLLFPLAILGYAASGTPHSSILYSLIGLQLLVQFGIAISSIAVKRTMKQDRPSRAILAIWTFVEALAGVVWALMLLPITHSMGINGSQGVNMAALTACVTLIVTLTASCLMAATVSRLVYGLLIGFAATAIPIMIAFQDIFSTYATSAILLFLSGILFPIYALKRQALGALKAEMEVAMLTLRLSRALDDAAYLSRHDALTGLLNRRDFDAVAESVRQCSEPTKDAQEASRNTAIILLDLDQFKRINDHYGHATGDEVLKATAAILQSQVSAKGANSGAIARWGGEEFVIALGNCDVAQAEQVAENIRAHLNRHRAAGWPETLSVSASFGITAWQPDQPLHDAIGNADRALYAAKNAGRDCIQLG